PPHEVLRPGGVQVANELRISLFGQGAALDGAPRRAAPDRLRPRVPEQEAKRLVILPANHAEGAILGSKCPDQGQGGDRLLVSLGEDAPSASEAALAVGQQLGGKGQVVSRERRDVDTWGGARHGSRENTA